MTRLDHATKPGPWFLAAPSTSASRPRAMRPGLVSFKVQQQWCLIYIYLYRNIWKYIAYNIRKMVYTHFPAMNWWGVFFPYPYRIYPYTFRFLGNLKLFWPKWPSNFEAPAFDFCWEIQLEIPEKQLEIQQGNHQVAAQPRSLGMTWLHDDPTGNPTWVKKTGNPHSEIHFMNSFQKIPMCQAFWCSRNSPIFSGKSLEIGYLGMPGAWMVWLGPTLLRSHAQWQKRGSANSVWEVNVPACLVANYPRLVSGL